MTTVWLERAVVPGSPGENIRVGVWGRGLSIGKGGERVSSSVLGWVQCYTARSLAQNLVKVSVTPPVVKSGPSFL